MASIKNQPEEQQQQPQEKNILDTIKQKKGIIIGVAATIIVLVGGIITCNTIKSHNNEAATAALADARIKETTLGNDSLSVQDYINVAQMSGDAADVAKLEVAIKYYNQGKYDEAIKYLEDADVDSDIINAGRYSLMGDCYVNTQKLDKALECYEKAIKEADGNKVSTPFILVKEANVYREQGNFAKEAECYKQVCEQYPEYAASLNIDIRKFQVAAETSAASK